jgi:hypothetical protein
MSSASCPSFSRTPPKSAAVALRAIELHDSTIDEVAEDEGVLILGCTVYVQASEHPGSETGEGAFQEAVIRVKDGVLERDDLELPCLLDGGSLVLDGEKFDEVLPLPLEREGETALLLSPAESSEFVIRGSGIEIELLGDESHLPAQ